MGFMWGNTPVTGICWNGNTGVSAMYNGQLVWPVGPKYTYTVLWSTTTPAKNMYSISLSDSINNYDELIVYGSANRDSQIWLNTQNRYVVAKNVVNNCACMYAGRWNTGSTFILANGTDLRISGTSGYIGSSYFIGQANGSTAWSQGVYNTARATDLHPYKIVGVKEVK